MNICICSCILGFPIYCYCAFHHTSAVGWCFVARPTTVPIYVSRFGVL